MKLLHEVIICSVIIILSVFIAPSFSLATFTPSFINDFEDTIPVYSYEVVNTFPHDRHAFTQGLIFYDGYIYEGTGINGHSTLRKEELETGNILLKHKLSFWYFGEGITMCDNKIVQLTWKSKTGFVYDKKFNILSRFKYDTEGWGITYDGVHLIMSDGSSNLYFLSPDTFNVVKRIQVMSKNTLVTNINELEYVKGTIYANIWQTDYIAMIIPETGKISGWINLTGLLDKKYLNGGADVLNGIAYDKKKDRLFVTGKFWPYIYEIKIILQK